MKNVVYLVDNIASSDYGYYVIIIALSLIAICMFFLIFSQYKLIKMHKQDKSIDDKIEEMEERNIDLEDTAELPVLKENIFYEKEDPVIEAMASIPEDDYNEEKETPISISELEDLQSITREIELNPIVKKSSLTQYEAEQEERAIISYDELLAKSDNVSIVYSDSKADDDILVKKVDLEQTGKIELDPIKKQLNSKVTVMSYDHEEAFLNALKDLSNFLN